MSMPVHTVFFTLALAGCRAPQTGPDSAAPPPIAQDATTVDGASYTPCDMVCVRYRELRCPEGDDSPADETGARHPCEEVCQNSALHGIDLAGPVSCTSSAPSCDAVRKCSGG
jgi:hypothetical protein